MRLAEAFCNISMCLYNKNVLEYAQIGRSGQKSMILNIEGSTNKQVELLGKKTTHNFAETPGIG